MVGVNRPTRAFCYARMTARPTHIPAGALPAQGVVSQMVARYGERVVCTGRALERNTQRPSRMRPLICIFCARPIILLGRLAVRLPRLAWFGRSIPVVLAEGKTPGYQWQSALARTAWCSPHDWNSRDIKSSANGCRIPICFSSIVNVFENYFGKMP